MYCTDTRYLRLTVELTSKLLIVETLIGIIGKSLSMKFFLSMVLTITVNVLIISAHFSVIRAKLNDRKIIFTRFYLFDENDFVIYLTYGEDHFYLVFADDLVFIQN